MAAGIGASAILATSALAFTVVKYLGAAYLVFLGVTAIARAGAAAAQPRGDHPAADALLRAFVTGVLNPKVVLFFLAFLPQFVDPAHGSVFVQCLLLGTLLAAMDIAYESGLAWLAGSASEWVRTPRVTLRRERVSGGVLVGLGVRLALVERE